MLQVLTTFQIEGGRMMEAQMTMPSHRSLVLDKERQIFKGEKDGRILLHLITRKLCVWLLCSSLEWVCPHLLLYEAQWEQDTRAQNHVHRIKIQVFHKEFLTSVILEEKRRVSRQ